jgi:spermidine/putrescine transport system substrate-binding protein
MMKKIALLALAAVLWICARCPPAAAESITVFNWYDYIGETAIRIFEEETGIRVKYLNFTTNEEMYTMVTESSNAYDVIFPSDYIVERMINEDLLEKLDLESMPNTRNLIDWLRAPDYDPTGEYSIAYMWGTVGILYNTSMVDEEIDSWAQLFDVKYKRNVIMIESVRDSMAVALKMLGYSLNTRDLEELEAAKQALIRQKQDGVVKGYLVDETKDKMISGEAALAVMWSGDALYSMAENEDLKYIVPREGSNVWVDGMCVPKGSQNIEAAQKFIDFMCRPDIARMNMEYIYYSTPIRQVAEEMDEDERNNLALNPTDEILERCEFFRDLAGDMALYAKIWMEIRAS